MRDPDRRDAKAGGALRDMTPNHLFQILAMVATEPPNSFDAEAVPAEKSRVFEAVENQSLEQALSNSVRGQYRKGNVLDAWKNSGEVCGYAAGSNGLVEADAFMARDGRSWRPLE